MPATPPSPSRIPSGVKLSAQQVAQLARNAGFPEKEVPMAVAVAKLESGYDPNIEGRTDPRDKGLMQINSHFHPEVLSINWRNPQENMSLAFRIWSTRGWGEWHTANAALLVSRGPDIRQAVASSHSVGEIAGAVAENAIPGFREAKDVAEAGAAALRFLSVGRNWGRIGEIALGGVLLIVALARLTQPVVEPAVKTAVKVGAATTPAGKAAAAGSGLFGAWK